MQSYCIFCIYTTFYTIKAYIITIKNKLMNKIPYRYTTKLLSRTIGGSVGMAGCHTLLIKDCLVGALLALASGKAERRQGISGNLVGISINLCKSIQKELFINDTP